MTHRKQRKNQFVPTPEDQLSPYSFVLLYQQSLSSWNWSLPPQLVFPMAHICDSSAAPVITAESSASQYMIHYGTHKYCFHVQIYTKDIISDVTNYIFYCTPFTQDMQTCFDLYKLSVPAYSYLHRIKPSACMSKKLLQQQYLNDKSYWQLNTFGKFYIYKYESWVQ